MYRDVMQIEVSLEIHWPFPSPIFKAFNYIFNTTPVVSGEEADAISSRSTFFTRHASIIIIN
jgi:hypothetical protein